MRLGIELKDLLEAINLLRDSKRVYFEIEGDTPDGNRTTFPMGIKDVYLSRDNKITVLFEDN